MTTALPLEDVLVVELGGRIGIGGAGMGGN